MKAAIVICTVLYGPVLWGPYWPQSVAKIHGKTRDHDFVISDGSLDVV